MPATQRSPGAPDHVLRLSVPHPAPPHLRGPGPSLLRRRCPLAPAAMVMGSEVSPPVRGAGSWHGCPPLHPHTLHPAARPLTPLENSSENTVPTCQFLTQHGAQPDQTQEQRSAPQCGHSQGPGGQRPATRDTETQKLPENWVLGSQAHGHGDGGRPCGRRTRDEVRGQRSGPQRAPCRATWWLSPHQPPAQEPGFGATPPFPAAQPGVPLSLPELRRVTGLLGSSPAEACARTHRQTVSWGLS